MESTYISGTIISGEYGHGHIIEFVQQIEMIVLTHSVKFITGKRSCKLKESLAIEKGSNGSVNQLGARCISSDREVKVGSSLETDSIFSGLVTEVREIEMFLNRNFIACVVWIGKLEANDPSG